MKTSYLVGVIVVIVLVFGVWFFASQNKQQVVPTPPVTESVQTPAPEEKKEASDAAMAADVKEVMVEGSPFKFVPTEIKVKKGQTVKVIFKNVAGMHDFVVDEFKARTKVIKASETDTIQFVADKAGTFEYYCSVGNHRAMGMKGNLIVE